MKFILGKKISISQVFNEKGNIVPVTLIEAGPCFITQVKTKDRDGYQSIQLGFKKIEKEKRIKKTMKGKPFFYLKEFKTTEGGKKNQSAKENESFLSSFKVGDEVNVSIFQQGDKLKISGISKGKGFQGGVKRWGFKGALSASHGTKHEHRTLGSTGSRFPQRVIKGRKMPGHMGSERVTIKNLEIIRVDKENNLLTIKGAVPGSAGTLLEIRG